jgi:signal transduction histidine kinase
VPSREEILKDVEAVGRITAVPTILQVVSRITGMRFAAVARVTDSTWTACAVYDLVNFGLKPGGDLVLESTICNEIRQHGKPVLFNQATTNPLFMNHPTPKMYGFESYVSIPIFRGNGDFFGTLCALDPLPAKVEDPNVQKTLELFAQLIAAQLDTEERLEQSEGALGDARETAKLREQFIAVLGHDLRQPLQAVRLGAEVLAKAQLEPKQQRVVKNIQRSTGRMQEMIANVLDFARGRLGGGIPVALYSDEILADDLRHVIDEVKSTHPDHVIESDLQIDGPVVCDRSRISQLLSNLLTNAVTHGDAAKPVRISAHRADGHFELAVANGGEPIPAESIARLFQPFSRNAASAPAPGLGLGLYIAAEIARAHRGTLNVWSSASAGTRFIFRMPLQQA